MKRIRTLSADQQEALYKLVCKRFHYVEETGQLIWKSVTPNNIHLLGKAAGYKKPCRASDNNEYIRIHLGRVNYYAHHLVYLMCKGKWPSMDLDHKSGDTLDNRIENLREATAVVNGQNQQRHLRNKSGCTGVHFNTRQQNWVAYIRANGKEYT